MSQITETKGPNIGFGLERPGLWCASYPRLAALCLLSILSICLYGASRVQIEDQLSELFRSDHVEFQKFDNTRKMFRESENDIAVLIEAEDMLTRPNLEAAQLVQLDTLLIDGVASAFSMFSMYKTPDSAGNSDPLFPDPLPEGEEFTEFKKALINNKLINGRLYSEDLTHILIILALDSSSERPNGELVAEIKETAQQIVAPLGLNVYLGGMPVLRSYITSAVAKDQIIFNGAGLIIGLILCYLFLRSVVHTVITIIPPIAAVIFATGIMGYIGADFNALSVLVPPLIMVLAFADSLHVVFAARRGLSLGLNGADAARYAVREVGPACVLTSLTTAIALVAVSLSSSQLISAFGLVAALGAMMSYCAVIMVTPTLIALFFRPGSHSDHAAPWINWLTPRCGELVTKVGAHARAVSLFGLAAIIACLVGIYGLTPHYQLSAYLPSESEVRESNARMDSLFGGAVDIVAVVRWEGSDQFALMTAVEAVRDVHKVIEEDGRVTNVWSAETLRRWLAPDTARGGEIELAQFISSLPSHWLDRLVSPNANAALIGGRIADLESAEIRDIADRLEQEANRVVTVYPGVDVDITGITTLSARESKPMIEQLGISLLMAVFVVTLLLAVSFRDARAAWFSFWPNLLPLISGGALLAALGIGLRYELVIALTVAFGIAVDNVIHFLHHVSRRGWRRAATAGRIRETAERIGPVLVITTSVLGLGLGITWLSVMPSIRGFGGMCVWVLVMALIASLVFLPALLRLRLRS